jgi:hypothetical protein
MTTHVIVGDQHYDRENYLVHQQQYLVVAGSQVFIVVDNLTGQGISAEDYIVSIDKVDILRKCDFYRSSF